MINTTSGGGASARRRWTWREWLDLAAAVAMIGTSGFLLAIGLRAHLGKPAAITSPRASNAGQIPLPSRPVSVLGLPELGNPKARVALIEDSDFQCPFCRRFVSDALPELKKRYIDTGRVVLAFRENPLPMHPLARPAAEAAVCAAEQGRFWDAHDLFFKDQTNLAKEIETLPGVLSLDPSGFAACLGSLAAKRVDSDLSTAHALGIESTPGFMVGVIGADGDIRVLHTIRGAQPVEIFERAIDDALSKSAVPNHVIVIGSR